MSKINIADKATLDKVYNIVSADGVYGFIEHMSILSPGARIEYIGMNADYTPVTVTKGGGYSLNSWAEFPWLLGNQPYMVNSDGTPYKRLNEENYNLYEDGTESDVANADFDGGAFAWAPKIYKYEKTVGNDRIVKFSFEKRDGFEPVGFLNPENEELEGVWIPMFYGSIIDEKMRSISGNQPCYSKTTDAERTAIQKFSEKAHHLGGPIVETLIDLMILFAKTTNLQETYGYGNMSGYDSSLTPTYGVKTNAVISGGQFYGTSDGKSLNKIFHSIVLGSYQQWMRDPYTLLVNGRYKVSKNYTYDLTGTNYTDTGISLPKITKTDETQNIGPFYPHKYQAVPGFGAVPVYPYKGSTSTGGCDALWQNVEITAVARRFGDCHYGTIDGPRALYLGDTAGYANWYIGAAVLLLPPVGVAG
jgi:hypothetical protein